MALQSLQNSFSISLSLSQTQEQKKNQLWELGSLQNMKKNSVLVLPSLHEHENHESLFLNLQRKTDATHQRNLVKQGICWPMNEISNRVAFQTRERTISLQRNSQSPFLSKTKTTEKRKPTKNPSRKPQPKTPIFDSPRKSAGENVKKAKRFIGVFSSEEIEKGLSVWCSGGVRWITFPPAMDATHLER